MSWLLPWDVEVPGFEPVRVYADTAAAACFEAAELHHLQDIPPNTTARDQRGQEFACSSAP